MDKLIEIQKQDAKARRNRESRRRRNQRALEAKLSKSMQNLQKDGIHNIVYEGLFINEKNKEKDAIA